MPRMRDAGIHDMIDRADKALYRSKRGGENRVTVAPPPVSTDAGEAEPGCVFPPTDSYTAEE